jgi:hypothetical protein
MPADSGIDLLRGRRLMTFVKLLFGLSNVESQEISLVPILICIGYVWVIGAVLTKPKDVVEFRYGVWGSSHDWRDAILCCRRNTKFNSVWSP